MVFGPLLKGVLLFYMYILSEYILWLFVEQFFLTQKFGRLWLRF